MAMLQVEPLKETSLAPVFGVVRKYLLQRLVDKQVVGLQETHNFHNLTSKVPMLKVKLLGETSLFQVSGVVAKYLPQRSFSKVSQRAQKGKFSYRRTQFSKKAMWQSRQEKSMYQMNQEKLKNVVNLKNQDKQKNSSECKFYKNSVCALKTYLITEPRMKNPNGQIFCLYCDDDRVYCNRNALKQHQRSKHPFLFCPSLNHHTCTGCGQTFLKKAMELSHVCPKPSGSDLG